jgi:hypothetical protein
MASQFIACPVRFRTQKVSLERLVLLVLRGRSGPDMSALTLLLREDVETVFKEGQSDRTS